MEVCILGPVEVDGRPVGGREAAVLAALAVRAPRAASADALVDDVWGSDPPVTAPKALQNAISKLRRTLGADAIETVAGGYRLCAAVDLHEVERLAAAGDAESALDRWRGDPAAVPAAERARLDELRASLEDDAVRARLARGEVDGAVATLERLVAADPYREPRWALLVGALGRAGRQGDALRAAQRARRVLADDLGLDPGPELVAAEQSVLAPPATVLPQRRRMPKPSTSFVGRAADLGRVRAALHDHRLVSLVGAGGVGKTRLATAALEDREAVFVDLAAVRADHVWEAIAAAAAVGTETGRSVADAVVERLADELVVLDSCEHVLDAAADVAERVTCQVLTTSREPLGLTDEHVVPVQPLDRDDAVQLFVDRAGSAADDDVVVLCEQLDGLPLAIELAAARAPVLDASQIVARLDDRFGLLDDRARRGQRRHRSLGAMVEWSYDLLDDDERRLFVRLSVFRSSFTLEDAEAVVVDHALPARAVAPALTRLVRASMVTVDAEHRFRLLDTFRAFAETRVDEPQQWRRRHLDWVVGLAAAAGPELSGPNQLTWFARIGAALDDVQEALAWCAEHGPPRDGLSIAANLFHFWMGRARRAEGLEWLERFAELATDVPALDRCRALFGAAMIAMLTDVSAVERLAALAGAIADDRDARAVADAAAAISHLFRLEIDATAELVGRSRAVLDEPQHDGTLAQQWDERTWLAVARGDAGAARPPWQRAVASLRSMGDRHLYGGFLAFDSDLAFAVGEHDEAQAIAREALDIARDVGCPSCLSSALAMLATVVDAEDVGGRVTALRRAVELAAGINEVLAVEWATHTLAAALADDDPDRAAVLLGGVDACRERLGHQMLLPGRTVFADARFAAARARLGPARWDGLVAEGRRLGYDELVALALS